MKKQYAKRALAALAAMAMAVSFAACGGSTSSSGGASAGSSAAPSSATESKEPVTVVYVIASSQANNQGTLDAIAKWEEKTGNKIDLQSVPDDQYDSVVTARLSGNDGIDIFQGPLQSFDAENTMVEFVGEDFEERLSEPVLRSIRTPDGKYYGYPGPGGISTFGFWYNKAVFEEAGITELPTTFEGFSEMCQKIKDIGVTPIYLAGKDGYTLLQHRNAVSGAIYGEDPDVWTKLNANEIQWTEIPEFKAQMEALAGWAKDGFINDHFLTGTDEESKVAVANGEAAMLINGSWAVRGLLTQNPDMEVGFLPLPTSSGTPCIPVSGYGGGWHIAKSSKVQEQALDFLRFMTSPEVVSEYMKAAPGVVAYNDVPPIENSPAVFDEVQQYIGAGQVSPHGDTEYIVPQNGNEIIALYQELIAGRITADEFVQGHADSYVNNAQIAGIPNF